MSTSPSLLLPVINAARCTGCGWCVAACPWHLLSLERQGWRKRAVLHDAHACTGCSLCAVKCPLNVIDMVAADQAVPTKRLLLHGQAMG